MTVLSQTSRDLFTGSNITTSTYTYNNTGWIKIRADEVYLQTRVSTLNATSLSFRLEGRQSSTDKIASMLISTETSAQSISKLTQISPRINEVRLGAKIDFSSTPNNFYANLILTELR